MSGNRMNDLVPLSVFPGQISPNQRMRSFHLMIYRLSNIVKKGSGVHNLDYADELLKYASKRLDEALKQLAKSKKEVAKGKIQ
jgi:hypothetical protein